MILLGIDPGATTGWVHYCADQRKVLAAGNFRGDDLPEAVWKPGYTIEHAIIESLVPARGNIFPAVVDSAVTQGHIERQLIHRPHRMTRLEVKQTLTEAVLREPVVKDDKTAWQALVALHGPGSDQKRTKDRQEGCIGLVTGHERAALAVAVAWAIRNRLAFVGGTA